MHIGRKKRESTIHRGRPLRRMFFIFLFKSTRTQNVKAIRQRKRNHTYMPSRLHFREFLKSFLDLVSTTDGAQFRANWSGNIS